jgi:hypothetical protein
MTSRLTKGNREDSRPYAEVSGKKFCEKMCIFQHNVTVRDGARFKNKLLGVMVYF